MKISAKARYGLRILLDIASNGTVEKPRRVWSGINTVIRDAFAGITLKGLMKV